MHKHNYSQKFIHNLTISGMVLVILISRGKRRTKIKTCEVKGEIMKKHQSTMRTLFQVKEEEK